MSEQPKTLPGALDQRLRRLAYRFANNDEEYDYAVEALTDLVSEALDYHKTSVQETMASVLAQGARQQADKLEAQREPEQPKPTTGKRLKLHQKADLVIHEWLGAFEGASGRGVTDSDGGALLNIDRRLKTVFQDDEQTRADLLAACEAVVNRERQGVEMCCTAILKAKETDRC